MPDYKVISSSLVLLQEWQLVSVFIMSLGYLVLYQKDKLPCKRVLEIPGIPLAFFIVFIYSSFYLGNIGVEYIKNAYDKWNGGLGLDSKTYVNFVIILMQLFITFICLYSFWKRVKELRDSISDLNKKAVELHNSLNDNIKPQDEKDMFSSINQNHCKIIDDLLKSTGNRILREPSADITYLKDKKILLCDYADPGLDLEEDSMNRLPQGRVYKLTKEAIRKIYEENLAFDKAAPYRKVYNEQLNENSVEYISEMQH